MPRRRRRDKPGRLHHIVSRGQDRQKLFHRDPDYRFFLALLGCAVIRGRIRLHAFSLMPNHIHLLVESMDGELSATMQWILGRYGGYFNATHEHEGHVFGARFHSFPVLSAVYLLVLLRYIDRNPIKTAEPEDPLTLFWCSAFHHARQGPRPRWLARNLVDRLLRNHLERGGHRETAYRQLFHVSVPDPAGDEIVESRIASGFWIEDELDLIVRMGTSSLAEWLLRRATGASSHSVLLVVLDARSVRTAVAEVRASQKSPGGKLCGVPRRDVFAFIEVGLLKNLAGCTLKTAASLVSSSVSRAQQRDAIHREALLVDEHYRHLASLAAQRALALAYPSHLRTAAGEITCV